MSKKKLFIIDTIATYRMRYAVMADSLAHAQDEVCMIGSGNPDDQFDEVTQKYLGENIIDGRQISKKEFDAMLVDLEKNDDELANFWLGRDLIRTIKYKED